MYNRVKYLLSKNFKMSSIKERLIKNKVKYTQPPKKAPFNIIIRRYHSSKTNSINDGTPKI